MEAVDFGSFIVVCIGCYTFISFVYMLEGRSFITFTMFGFGSGLRSEGKYQRQPEGLAIAWICAWKTCKMNKAKWLTGFPVFKMAAASLLCFIMSRNWTPTERTHRHLVLGRTTCSRQLQDFGTCKLGRLGRLGTQAC